MISFGGDYKSQLNEMIDELFTRIEDVGIRNMPVERRIKDVERITNAYVEQTGERPTPGQLDRLSTYILLEDKLRRKGVKVVDEGEYPILSDSQYEKRTKRESSLVSASSFDSGRVDRKLPTRMNRIKTELSNRKIK